MSRSKMFLLLNKCPLLNSRCSTLDINEVLALDRFRVHHKFHLSPKHLPVTPSNLLKSELINNINDKNTDTEDVKFDDEVNDELLSLSKPSQYTEDETEILSPDLEASQPNYDQVCLENFRNFCRWVYNLANFCFCSSSTQFGCYLHKIFLEAICNLYSR